MNHKQYNEDFKKSVVNLIQNGKTQVQVSKEYGISLSAISRWVRQAARIEKIDLYAQS